MTNQNTIDSTNKKPENPVKDQISANRKLIGQIIGLGVVAGMRTTYAPAVLSHYLNKNPDLLKDSALGFVASPVTSVVTKLMAAGETVGDKLPTAPDRIAFPQILGRIVSGAFTGLVLSKAANKSIISGFLLGGVSAVAGSFGAFYIRKYIDELPNVKDVFVGAGEDILALGTGALLMK